MEIDLQTKIGELLDAYPELEATLLELSPAFAKLRNPVLRRTVAKVVTIQQAAKMAGISPVDMVQTLRKKAGLSVIDNPAGDNEQESDAMPEWLDVEKIVSRFDATPVIESGKSPLAAIMHLADNLRKGEILELTAPFRPEPIIEKMINKGFQVWYKDGKSYFLK
jgi:hypothetical protein